MKILYVTSTPLEYSSSANMRNIALIKGLMENGNEIYTLSSSVEEKSKYIDKTLVKDIVFSKRFWFPNTKIHEKLTTKADGTQSAKGTLKSKLIKKVYSIYSKLRIYDSRKSLVKKINKGFIEDSFDIIISSSDPKSSHLIAKKLIKQNPGIAKKWIQYWGDPFSSDINKKTWVPNLFVKKEEERLIKACDYVIYVSPFTLEQQKKNFKKHSDKMYFLPIPYSEPIFYDKTNNKNILLGYYGDYKENDRNIMPLYNVARKLNVELNVYGNSDVTLQKTENINIEPRQSMEIVRQAEKNTDLLVCICNKSGTQIPGKIYHYAATNKPILIILDGERKEELREYFGKFERYILCENNEKDIENIIKQWEEFKSKEYLPCKYFKPDVLAKQLIKITKNKE